MACRDSAATGAADERAGALVSYTRVYYSILDDEKFDGIRDDMRLFGSWVMLLVVADMAYPAPAFVPPTVPKAALRRLTECGLVDELAGHRYRIHGLEAERSRRSAAARVGGLASGRSRGVERHRNNRSTPIGTKSNLDENEYKNEYETSTPRGALDNVDAAWSAATGKTLLGSGQYALDYIEDATQRHGVAAVITAIRECRSDYSHVPAPQPLATAVRNLLDPLPSGKDTAAAEAVKREEIRSRRAVEGTIRTAHKAGFHDETADPRCPLCKEPGA